MTIKLNNVACWSMKPYEIWHFCSHLVALATIEIKRKKIIIIAHVIKFVIKNFFFFLNDKLTLRVHKMALPPLRIL